MRTPHNSSEFAEPLNLKPKCVCAHGVKKVWVCVCVRACVRVCVKCCDSVSAAPVPPDGDVDQVGFCETLMVAVQAGRQATI